MTAILGVRAEVWPVAADSLGIWLVSPDGDAWRSGLIEAESEAHRAAEQILDEHGDFGRLSLLHSTSWRMDGASVVLTYVAVLGSHGSQEWVRDVWPSARPLTVDVADLAGKPFPHGAAEPPTPRYLDVLMHAVRHLRFLLDSDVSAQAPLDDHWRRALHDMEPVLAGMYQ